jgi:hypothetical protein
MLSGNLNKQIKAMTIVYNTINFYSNNVFIINGDKKKDVDSEEVLSNVNVINKFEYDDHPLIEQLKERILQNEKEKELLKQLDGESE